jgi:hypothetical protein
MASEQLKGSFDPTVQSEDDSLPPPPNVPKLSDRYADESYKLFQKLQVTDPTPEEARKIRNKCLRRILPFLCIGYHLMYVDKQTVGTQNGDDISLRYAQADADTVRKLSNSWDLEGCPSQF